MAGSTPRVVYANVHQLQASSVLFSLCINRPRTYVKIECRDSLHMVADKIYPVPTLVCVTALPSTKSAETQRPADFPEFSGCLAFLGKLLLVG